MIIYSCGFYVVCIVTTLMLASALVLRTHARYGQCSRKRVQQVKQDATLSQGPPRDAPNI